MKRIGFLHEKICEITNINLADKNASKNKGTRLEVIKHNANKKKDNLDLQKILKEAGLKFSNWNGIEKSVTRIYNKNIKIINLIRYKKYFQVLYIYKNKAYYFNSKNKYLFYFISRYKLPYNFKIYLNAKHHQTRRKT